MSTRGIPLLRWLLAPALALALLALGGCFYGPPPHYGGYAPPAYYGGYQHGYRGGWATPYRGW
jgi:hypothetical protein